MKIKSIAAICKKNKQVVLFNRYGREFDTVTQYMGAGRAVYLINGLPELDEESILTIFDVPEKQREDWLVKYMDIPEGVNFDDTERIIEQGNLSIVYTGKTLKPLQTRRWRSGARDCSAGRRRRRMKIKELDQYCGACDVAEYCGNSFGYCLCHDNRFENIEEAEYKKIAEIATDIKTLDACEGCRRPDCGSYRYKEKDYENESCDHADEARDFYCKQIADFVEMARGMEAAKHE